MPRGKKTKKPEKKLTKSRTRKEVITDQSSAPKALSTQLWRDVTKVASGGKQLTASKNIEPKSEAPGRALSRSKSQSFKTRTASSQQASSRKKSATSPRRGSK